MPMIVAVRISHWEARSPEKLLGIQSVPNQIYQSDSHRSSQFIRV